MSAELEIDPLEQPLAGWKPEDILEWAVERYPRITFATGFGVEGCCLLDMIARRKLPIDVFTLDTGLLFPETYALWRRIEERYGVTVRGVRPKESIADQTREHGPNLWSRTPEKCCEIRKVVPLREALAPFDAWITAIRSDQTPDRADASVVEADRKFGLVKVNPLLAWTVRDVWNYTLRNDVPYNSLHNEGYSSIGCWPCTSPVAPGEAPRAGRWRGLAKKECGLHVRPPVVAVNLNEP